MLIREHYIINNAFVSHEGDCLLFSLERASSRLIAGSYRINHGLGKAIKLHELVQT